MRSDQLSRVLLAAYIVGLAVLVLVPSGRAMDLGDRLNLEPRATIDRALDMGPRSIAFRLMLANIAAFVPLGILIPMAFRTRWSIGLVAVTALGLSLAVELGQLAVSVGLGYAYRSTDIDDVILNVLGAALGYAAFTAARMIKGLQPSR